MNEAVSGIRDPGSVPIGSRTPDPGSRLNQRKE